MRRRIIGTVIAAGIAGTVGMTSQAAQTENNSSGIGIRYGVQLDLPQRITVGDHGKVNYRINPVGDVKTTGTVDFHAEKGPIFQIKGDQWYAVSAGEVELAPEVKLSEETQQLLIAKYHDYSIQDIQQVIPVKVLPASQAVYRLYNPQSGEHFYTKEVAEKNHLAQVGWKFEGTSWQSYQDGVPVYRVYNPNAGDHHYTLAKDEVNYLVSQGWQDEGISFYSAVDQKAGVYRVYNPNAQAGSHHYTLDKNEQQALKQAGWQDEGISWYDE